MLVYRILHRPGMHSSTVNQIMLPADRCIIGLAPIGEDRREETCRGLTSIDMSGNSKMTDVGISYLASPRDASIYSQSISEDHGLS